MKVSKMSLRAINLEYFNRLNFQTRWFILISNGIYIYIHVLNKKTTDSIKEVHKDKFQSTIINACIYV